MNAHTTELARRKDPHELLRRKVPATLLSDAAFDAWTWRDDPKPSPKDAGARTAWFHDAHWHPDAALAHPDALLQHDFPAAPLTLFLLMGGEARRANHPEVIERIRKERPDMSE